MTSGREAFLRASVRPIRIAAVLVMSALPARGSLLAQQGEAWAVAAGGGLGFLSGALSAELAAIGPCNQTRWGVGCVQLSAGAGGTIGLAAGAAAGFQDAETIEYAALGAAIGFGVGAVGGVIVKPVAERFGWHDVATLGVIGASVGAAFPLLAWQLVPGFERTNVVSAALVGLAVGGITQWIVRVGADRTSDPTMRAGFPLGMTVVF
ncbi:MAG: hypothetical protein AMS20_16785 [Gemmatimonas sp. SG8_28]|nr:MAG: hypothetical protein AMS20_16785 [Gemmatimonas sp. SG8_28]